jgi:choline dehydrogenase
MLISIQDHTLIPFIWEVQPGYPTAETIKEPGVLEYAMGEFQEGRGGPLTSGVSNTAFLSYVSILQALKGSSGDINKISLQTKATTQKQAELQQKTFTDENESAAQFNFAATGWNPYASKLSTVFTHNDPGNFAGVGVSPSHPLSRGSTHIQSNSPVDHPLIDPRYFSHPADMEVMIDAVLFAQLISETAPLSNFLKDRPNGEGKIIQPNFKMNERLTRETARTFVKAAAGSSWHPIGTCAMLPRAEGGVVDPRLRVYGTKNLRVVDASIMPLQVRGNIASAVYAIAEKAADLIKEDWKAHVNER